MVGIINSGQENEGTPPNANDFAFNKRLELDKQEVRDKHSAFKQSLVNLHSTLDNILEQTPLFKKFTDTLLSEFGKDPKHIFKHSSKEGAENTLKPQVVNMAEETLRFMNTLNYSADIVMEYILLLNQPEHQELPHLKDIKKLKQWVDYPQENTPDLSLTFGNKERKKTSALYELIADTNIKYKDYIVWALFPDESKTYLPSAETTPYEIEGPLNRNIIKQAQAVAQQMYSNDMGVLNAALKGNQTAHNINKHIIIFEKTAGNNTTKSEIDL